MLRPISRPARSWAKAHQMLPMLNTANPISTGHRRPYRSEIGPTASWPIANTARKTVIAEVTAALETFRAIAIRGSEGSRMLVASVPVAASAASTATCGMVEAAGCGGTIAETVWSVMAGSRSILYDKYHIKRGREREVRLVIPGQPGFCRLAHHRRLPGQRDRGRH